MKSTKHCPRCKTHKALSEFNTCAAKKDGKQGYCRECMKQYSKDHLRTEKGKHTKQLWKKRYTAKNKDAVTTHASVRAALKAGKLIKQPCAVCDNRDSESHHDDYQYPLDVRWLCKTHHIMFQKVLTALSKCDINMKKYDALFKGGAKV